jgi:hypothetical protein
MEGLREVGDQRSEDWSDGVMEYCRSTNAAQACLAGFINRRLQAALKNWAKKST